MKKHSRYTSYKFYKLLFILGFAKGHIKMQTTYCLICSKMKTTDFYPLESFWRYVIYNTSTTRHHISIKLCEYYYLTCIPQALRTTGIRKNDPRIQEVIHNLYKVHKERNIDGGSPETLKLDRNTFKEVIAPNIVLITRAFRSQFVIPDFQDFIKDIEEMYWAAKSNTDGKVASYIPQLARANPDNWAVSVCTIDGQRFSIGKSSGTILILINFNYIYVIFVCIRVEFCL